ASVVVHPGLGNGTLTNNTTTTSSLWTGTATTAFGATGVTGVAGGASALNLVVLSSDSGTNTVSVLASSGTGSFTKATSFTAAAPPASRAAGKVGKDAAQDIVVANGTSGPATIYRNVGGPFTASTNLTVGGGPIDTVTAVAVADL